MPTLVVLGNVKVQVFANDHHPPHFHVTTPDGEAIVAIDGLRLLRGVVRRRDYDVALAWVRTNMTRVRDEWNRLQD